MDTLTNLTPAEKMYKSHLMNVSNYQKRNPDKMKLKYQKKMKKLKEDPIAYKSFRQKQNECTRRSILKRKQAFEAEKSENC